MTNQLGSPSVATGFASGARGAVSAVSWRRRSRPAALAFCCHIFATRVFICCNRLKSRRANPGPLPPRRTPPRRRSARPLETTTFVAGLTTRGMIAPFELDGPINRLAFETYAERVLASSCRSCAKATSSSWTICPATRGRKCGRGSKRQAAAFSTFRPKPPDFNPIENAFAELKALLAKPPSERSTVYSLPPTAMSAVAIPMAVTSTLLYLASEPSREFRLFHLVTSRSTYLLPGNPCRFILVSNRLI